MQRDTSRNAPVSAIFGATSALGQAVARRLTNEGHQLILCARDEVRLDTVAKDIDVRNGSTSTIGENQDNIEATVCHVIDFDQISEHEALVEAVGEADNFWFFYGTLPDQHACENCWASSAAAFHTNFTSAASLLTHLANHLEKRGSGSITVITSVAGDRGRKSNYVYGTAKGALSLFCQGLRNRLASSGVRVLTVKPGFIDTPMTKDIEKKPAMLWATVDQVAFDIVNAHKRGKDVIYSRWFWRYILLIIKNIPERIFKKLSL